MYSALSCVRTEGFSTLEKCLFIYLFVYHMRGPVQPFLRTQAFSNADCSFHGTSRLSSTTTDETKEEHCWA